MVRIDYKKVSDSLPPNCIIKCLETTGVNKHIRMFMEKIVKQWKVELGVGNEKYGLGEISLG